MPTNRGIILHQKTQDKKSNFLKTIKKQNSYSKQKERKNNAWLVRSWKRCKTKEERVIEKPGVGNRGRNRQDCESQGRKAQAKSIRHRRPLPLPPPIRTRGGGG